MSIFTEIIERKIPATIVAESDEFIAFKDIAPRARIHLLIVPKEEVRAFSDASPKLLGKMCGFIQEVVEKQGITNGFRLITNDGADANQEVPHLHFHLLAGEDLKIF